jgi:hypothetical protein
MEDMNKPIATESEVNDGAQHQEPEVVEQSKEKLFSQSELDSIIEKRLAKERNKWEKKVKEEADEAARLATMNEQEKQQALFEKRVRDFEEREAEFNAAQEALRKEKMLNETSKQLSERNLPIDFADKLMANTAEDTMANIEAFEKQWQAAINRAVDSKLKGTTPTSPKSQKPQKNVKDMSFSEFIEYNKNKIK